MKQFTHERPHPVQDAPWPVAVPSWVIPGTAAENALFLHGRVQAAVLCCFELHPRLPAPLPPAPSCALGTGLTWHVHLPLDLPWEQGGRAAAAAAYTVVQAAAHLRPCGVGQAILHAPPLRHRAALADFVYQWQDAHAQHYELVLENGPDTPLADWLELALSVPVSLCLDWAHWLLQLAATLPPHPCGAGASAVSPVSAYPKIFTRALDELADEAALMARVRMIHWSAPHWTSHGGRDAHGALTALCPVATELAARLAARLQSPPAGSASGAGVVDVIEVFDWNGICASWPVLRAWRSALPKETAFPQTPIFKDLYVGVGEPKKQQEDA